MTSKINPETRAKLDALAAEIAQARPDEEVRAQTQVDTQTLASKAEAAVSIILVRDAEALERLADA